MRWKLNWRNAVLMLMLAQGVPLLWSGDEMGNSQNGNNNAYCQDNPTGWVNWKNELHWMGLLLNNRAFILGTPNWRLCST